MQIKERLKRSRDFLLEYRTRFNNAKNLFDDSESRLNMEKYLHFIEKRRIREKAILYESFFGRGINDNPHAIFRFLLSDPRFSGFEHYWSVETLEDNEALMRYQHLKNVHFIERNSEEYALALATCKYLFNSVTFPPYFCKREGQVYVNTWHGTPMKSMGFEQVGGIVASANTVRNFLHADYLLSENDTMTEMYLKSYKMRGIYPGTIIEEGYPRTDTTLKADRQEVEELLTRIGITIEPGKKIVMYAPTWRESKGGAVINPEELSEFKNAVGAVLDSREYQVILKPHQYIYNAIKDMPQYKGLLIPSWVDTNEILSIVDVLVSDFSSIIFDFLVLKKPMVFYIPDLEDYVDSRGLDMSLDELPGPYTDKLSEVASLIKSMSKEEAFERQYRHMLEQVCPYDDGDVTKRIVDIVFFGRTEYRRADASTAKQSLLISGGDLYLNGITRSLISLLKQIDYEKWDVTVFFNWTKPSLRYLLEEIDSRARVLIRTGAFFRDRREDALIETLDEIGIGNDLGRRMYPWHVFKREYVRCFGTVTFSRAIDYNGYVRQLNSMIAMSGAEKRFVWLHNDIYEDMNKLVNGVKKNYKVLNHTVSLFPEFDRIVSCGESVMLTNRDNLSTPETFDRFDYMHNTVDSDRIEKLLEEPTVIVDGLEYCCEDIKYNEMFDHKLMQLPTDVETTFINVGRMSTEKNQEALIRAFARIHEKYRQTALFILGDGPLRPQLEEVIEELDLSACVHLTGNVMNPFLFVERSNCFILPSTHEGQPLVVLEARACGLPIILGNFSTVEGVLIEDGQIVVETDEDSIYEGMLAFLKGNVPQAEFSVYNYNKDVYQEFERVIG